MSLSINIPVVPSPSIPAAITTVNTVGNIVANPSATVSSAIKSSIPTVSAPNLSQLAPTSLSGLASAARVPTSLSGLASATGISTSALGLNLPKISSWPGLAKPGIILGAGPNFLSQIIPKYVLIVPPFVPGLTLSIGEIAGALAIIKALASGNPLQFLNQLTAGFVNDLKGEASALVQTAENSSGISALQSQVSGIQSTVQAATSGGVSLTGVAAAVGAPTTVAGVASAAGVPTTVAGAASAAGIPTTVSVGGSIAGATVNASANINSTQGG